MERTPSQRLADELIDDLDEFVLSKRPARSWRLIARDLHEATDGKVDVTPETLRAWYAAAEQVPA